MRVEHRLHEFIWSVAWHVLKPHVRNQPAPPPGCLKYGRLRVERGQPKDPKHVSLVMLTGRPDIFKEHCEGMRVIVHLQLEVQRGKIEN